MPRLLLLLLLIPLIGCSGTGNNSSATPTPTPDDPKTKAAREEQHFQEFAIEKLNGEMRAQARNAVAEFVKSYLPGWTLKAISSQAYDGTNTYSMDADLERQNHHIVITFDVRKFFPDSGDSYWLAVPLNRFRFDRLHALTDADLRKQLEDAQNELENAREPPDSDSDNP
jgi:hypothetical protein